MGWGVSDPEAGSSAGAPGGTELHTGMDNGVLIRSGSELVQHLCLIQQLLEDLGHLHFLLHLSINVLTSRVSLPLS